MISNACPECTTYNERLGLRDGSCRPGCFKPFEAEETTNEVPTNNPFLLVMKGVAESESYGNGRKTGMTWVRSSP